MKAKNTKKVVLPVAEGTAAPTQKMDSGTIARIALSLIDVGTLNYRTQFNPDTIRELAASLLLNGMISPMTVRPIPGERFELVIGGRRYRAAQLAPLETVPVAIRNLTDQEVRQMQLAENMERENPHPLDEAIAISMLQEDGKSIDAIAAMLGKSKAFVYSRLKLSQLIVPLQQVFITDKINIQDALEIAALSGASQQEFFDSYCKDWEAEDFGLHNVRYLTSRFRYDLQKAPFGTADSGLLPEAGACGLCPFNSATLTTLFPEFSKTATCTNAACFKQKCNVSLERSIRSIVAQQAPAALLFRGNQSEEERAFLATIPELADLPVYGRYEVTILQPPVAPDIDDYSDSWVQEEGEEPEIDDAGYEMAMQEYEAEQQEYNLQLADEAIPKALCIENNRCSLVPFSMASAEADQSETKAVTAKAVQEAIKAGTATPELLNAEIDRINTREERAKELDREKIQLGIHEQFCEGLNAENAVCSLTAADLAAVKLLVYQSLDWSKKRMVDSIIFTGKKKKGQSQNEFEYEALSKLSDQHFSFLIRTAVVGKSESKVPGLINAICINQVAEAAGLDIKDITDQQGEKAAERQEKQALRIKELEKKIAKLNKQAA